MAVVIAQTTGNWSSTGTWLGGSLPQAGDDVYANNFTVTIDQNINVASLNNTSYTAPRNNPIMTGDNAPSGAASASSVESVTYQAFRAFDGSVASAGNMWRAAAATTTGWIQYEYNAAQIVTRYTIQSSDVAASNPFTWTFEAWDGAAWVTLHTVTSQVIALASTYDSGVFTNTTAYTRYRHNITAINGGTQLRVGEIAYFVTGFDRNATSGGLFDASVAGTTSTLTGGTPIAVTATTSVYRASNTSGTVTLTTNSAIAAATTVGGILHSSAGTFNLNVPQINGSGTNSVSTLARTNTGTLTFTGNILGGTGSATNSSFANTGAGTINIIGNITGGSSANSTFAISSSNATINVTGNITGGSNVSSQAIVVTSGSISVTGTVAGAAATAISTAGNATVIGNVSSSGAGAGIASASGIVVSITGNITANSAGGVGVNLSNSSSQCNLTGNLTNGNNIMAVWVPRLSISNSTTTTWALFTSTPSPRTLYSDDSFPNLPAVGNVRLGTTYGPGGTNTGTLAVPTPSNVLAGVATDNTVGTYTTTPTLIATEIFTKLLSSSDFNTSGSFGKLIKDNLDEKISDVKTSTDRIPLNPASIETTGDQVASYAV